MRFFSILLLILSGCSAQPTQPVILADSAFSGQAFLDVNENGQVDTEDTPIEGATFSVELNGVKAFGETTDESGNAFLLIPGGIAYPVRVSMEAPVDSGLDPVTPSTLTLTESAPATQFLFSSETK